MAVQLASPEWWADTQREPMFCVVEVYTNETAKTSRSRVEIYDAEDFTLLHTCHDPNVNAAKWDAQAWVGKHNLVQVDKKRFAAFMRRMALDFTTFDLQPGMPFGYVQMGNTYPARVLAVVGEQVLIEYEARGQSYLHLLDIVEFADPDVRQKVVRAGAFVEAKYIQYGSVPLKFMRQMVETDTRWLGKNRQVATVEEVLSAAIGASVVEALKPKRK